MNCEICKSKVSPIFWEKNGLKIYNCPSCEYKAVFPTPSDKTIKESYENPDYVNKVVIENNSGFFRIVRTKSEIELINGLYPGGRFLDCGSGDGMALYYADKLGLDAEGVEISEILCLESKRRYNVNVKNMNFLEYNPSKKFDVIRMKSYIEHLPNPKNHIQKAYTLLKPDGVLIVTTENYSSYDAKKRGVEWKYIIPPIHLSYFSRKSLGKIMKQQGFECILIDDRGIPRYTKPFSHKIIKNNPLTLLVGSFFQLNPYVTAYGFKKSGCKKIRDVTSNHLSLVFKIFKNSILQFLNPENIHKK